MPQTDLQSWARAYLGYLAGLSAEQIDLERELGCYGLDSVDAVLMAGEMEQVFGIEIDPASFLQYPTIGASLRALEQNCATPTIAANEAPPTSDSGEASR
jgi:polyketide synthase 13